MQLFPGLAQLVNQRDHHLSLLGEDELKCLKVV